MSSRYAILAAAQASDELLAALSTTITKACLKRGFAVAGSLKEGILQIIGDRASGYPDLQIEIKREGEIVLWDYGPSTRKAFKLVRRIAERKYGLSVVALPEADA